MIKKIKDYFKPTTNVIDKERLERLWEVKQHNDYKEDWDGWQELSDLMTKVAK